jgi:hypothetical protein
MTAAPLGVARAARLGFLLLLSLRLDRGALGKELKFVTLVSTFFLLLSLLKLYYQRGLKNQCQVSLYPLSSTRDQALFKLRK